MDACGAALLGEAHDGPHDAFLHVPRLRAAAAGHSQVGVLVDDHHEIGEEAVAVLGIELAVLVPLVVELDVVDECLAEQGVALVHLGAERTEDLLGLLRLLDDGRIGLLILVGGRRQDGEIMLEQASVRGELHHLRVDEDHLHLGGMLGVQEGCYQHVESDGLALLGGACHEQVRSVGQVEHLHLLGDGAADGDGQFGLAVAESLVIEEALQRNYRRLVVGHFYADGVGQGNDTHSAGVQGHGYVVLETADVGYLDARGGVDLVQGDGRADYGLDVDDLYLVVPEGGAYLVVVAVELLVGDYLRSGGMVLQQVQAGELVQRESLRRIQTYVNARKLLLHFDVQLLSAVDLETAVRLDFFRLSRLGSGFHGHCHRNDGSRFGFRLRLGFRSGLPALSEGQDRLAL